MPAIQKLALLAAFAVGIAIPSVAPAAEAPATPEVFAGVRVEATTLVADDGARLQAIVTRPEASKGRLPAILFIQWLSCSPVSIPADQAEKDGWSVMLESLITHSGAVVWRTEKRGLGGSEGKCQDLDYETEVADHRAALKALRARPDVDPDRVIVFGGSMGSNIAPLVAADQKLAGVVVWGGGARTWAERMLAFERNRLELGDAPVGQRAGEMALKFRLIDGFLLRRQTPEQMAAEDPQLGAAWSRLGGDPKAATLYGRPLAFHWQAQAQDWASAWTRVQAPVLAMFGEYDWFEDASGVQLIADVVNRGRPGAAQAVIIPGLDHHLSRYPNRRAAFGEKDGVVDPAPMLAVLTPWLKARQEAGQ